MTILWQPSNEHIEQVRITAFRRYVNERHGLDIQDYNDLHDWSVDNMADFWEILWDYCNVVGTKGKTVFEPGGHMMDARFFPDARLNFTENLLRRWDEGDAIVFRSETGYTNG